MYQQEIKKKEIMIINPEKIEQLTKQYSDKFEDFKVMFCETEIYFSGVLKSDSRRRFLYSFGYFYIPTTKGYISAKWKKHDLYTTDCIEVTQELLNSLEPFAQSQEPKEFLVKTAIPASNAIANFITKTGGDIYCNA